VFGGEVYDFYSASLEYFGYTVVSIEEIQVSLKPDKENSTLHETNIYFGSYLMQFVLE
jgi:hypothetical protein